MKRCFIPADILLPDFKYINGTKWATIACDQFTSQPEYWQAARELIRNEPSALDLILPEAYLDREESLLPEIAQHMDKYTAELLHEHKNSYVYVERKQSDGRVRHGLVGAVDLECYDWHKDAQTAVRATEETVPERIPPRVRIRREASIELPHIMLLIDDASKTVIERFASMTEELTPTYDFDLMLGGGSIKGWFVDGEAAEKVTADIEKLGEVSPLTIAVGDGNHSLATAKAVYEELKAELGDAALDHPARYALAELVNIHDSALDFEPIYRTVVGCDVSELLAEFEDYCGKLDGKAGEQEIRFVSKKVNKVVRVKHPEHQLCVGTVQRFLDGFIKSHPSASVDYIHGENNVLSLTEKDGVCGFIFDGMTKNDLFRAVACDGSLPRKTFSMGHAEDKRYYIEARKIVR